MAIKNGSPDTITVDARPYPFTFPVKQTALLVIDMQRDFLCKGGFGEIQGGDLQDVQASIAPTKTLLDACRGRGLQVFHTREGHVPSLADCPSSKLIRQAAAPTNSQHFKVIGDSSSMGRLMVRGEYGHDIVDELRPLPSEVVIDKPGKGSFWNTSILRKLKSRGITHLLVSGVTTECCFSTTIREANDRGFECCGITDSTAGYNPSFKTASLDMISWSQGLFGFVADLQPLLSALQPLPTANGTNGLHHKPTGPTVSWDGKLDIASLQTAYRNGLFPVTVAEAIYDRIEEYHKKDPAVWIHLQPREAVLETARKLAADSDPSRLPPLYGVPFSVKDSIDIQGVATTTACPPLSFVATASARCYEKVVEAGGLYFGKVNLDQLATGLSGCRSPYGMPRSVFSYNHISGGSSSGSCVSVGANLVTFSLATDTAGSGRVPACFNGIVGYKPTRGLISFENITPACLSLDCVAIMARTVLDARAVFNVCEDFDSRDRYARDTFPAERHVNALGDKRHSFTFGIPPPDALSACSPVYRRKFDEAVQGLQEMGGERVEIDWTPFQKASDLLYDGTFVSERLASLPDDFLEVNEKNLHPVILQLFRNVVARQSTAVQAYRDLQAKALYTRQALEQFTSATRAGVDVVVVPTTTEHPTVEAMLADPIALNSHLGRFTHFGNVLDLCAVATPAGTYTAETGSTVLPSSVTFLGARCTDSEVLAIADRFQRYVQEMHV